MAVSASAVLLLASQLLESTDLKLALRLNPLSAETRTKLIVEDLTANPARIESALAEAQEGQAFHRLDARFLSLAGLSAELGGNSEDAEKYFRSALAVAPTELRALLAMLRVDLIKGDTVSAAARLDVLTRRWGPQYETYTPFIPAIVSNEAGFEAVRDLFTQEKASRGLVLRGLLQVDEATGVAADLVASWAEAGVGDRKGLVNLVTARLLDLKRDQEAYLFYLQHGGAENRSNDYVNNGDFALPPDTSPFDWQVVAQRGVNITLDKDEGAKAQFLDSPVQLDNLFQLLALVPGRHSLSVEYTASYLKTPAPVRFEISCRSGQRLGSVSIDPSASGLTKSGIIFEVPQSNCVLQRLAVTSDKLPESWQNRYSGSFTIRRAKIERLE